MAAEPGTAGEAGEAGAGAELEDVALAGEAEEKEGSGPNVVPVTGTCANVKVSEVSPDPEAEEEGPRGDLPPGPEPRGQRRK